MKLKGLRAGLLSVWLSGFLLIALSFYGTQLLPPLDDRFRYSSDSISAPTITIFTALHGSFFFDHDCQTSVAIRSWLALSSKLTVVLFVQHNSSSSSSTDKFGSRLLLDSSIDFTFLGTPFLHSMVARTEAYQSDIAVLMDPETVLLPDFISALNHAHELDHDWLLVSSSVIFPRFPFHLDKTGHLWRQGNGKRVRFGEVCRRKLYGIC